MASKSFAMNLPTLDDIFSTQEERDLKAMTAGRVLEVPLDQIDEALTQKLHFGMLQNVYLRILDDRDGREILSYPLGNAFENVTSMTLGELYLHQGQWKFNPVGNGVHMDLAGQCALYGVTLA